MEGTLPNHVQGSIARVECRGQDFTVRVTVLDAAFPFFGVTVTVTRHDPFFRPFTDAPETLHTFAEDAATLSVNFDPEATVSPAYFATADAVADFFVVRDGAVLVVDGAVVTTLRGTEDVSVVLITGEE